MGSFFSSFFSLFEADKTYKITILGLHGVGKTTILNIVQFNQVVLTVPSIINLIIAIGCSNESIKINNVIFNTTDVGGQKDNRLYWPIYLHGCNAIVWVVDSLDLESLKESKSELYSILDKNNIKSENEKNELLNTTYNIKILLVLVHKQLSDKSLSASDITDKFDLKSLPEKGIVYNVIETNYDTKVENIHKGFEWMANEIKKGEKEKKD